MARKRKKADPKEHLFRIGERVRVRRGVIDPDWPDVPLGGWAGKVESYSESAEEGYSGFIVEVLWSKETLKQMPAICSIRADRDGLQCKRMNLREDELELDDGSPVVLEQPTNLISRPLELDDMEDRIRFALGLTSRDDPLPPVNEETLRRYWRRLNEGLSFPFAVWLSAAVLPGEQHSTDEFLVLRLLPVEAAHEFDGLRCEVRLETAAERQQPITPDDRNRSFEVWLYQTEVCDQPGPNDDLIGDYKYWVLHH
jgi:hypothetical protein